MGWLLILWIILIIKLYNSDIMKSSFIIINFYRERSDGTPLS